MFTGIVEELGSVLELAGGRLRVACRTVTSDSPVGASVAVNGVCLTVVERTDQCLGFDLSDETLARTALGRLLEGSPVNLERPVTLMTRLGGHVVQGHVDGVGKVASIDRGDAETLMGFAMPTELSSYIVDKGSIAVDGVSLTAVGVSGDRVEVALIPHTLAATTLGSASVEDPVNLEVDVIAKYVDRLLGGGARGGSSLSGGTGRGGKGERTPRSGAEEARG
jgi:riboflavin synthase